MKKNWTIRLLAGVAAGTMAFSMVGCGSSKDNSKNGGKEKFIVGFDAAFPPYESVDGDTIVGVDVDMMQAVCDEIGMELKVENMEFDSIIAAVQSGKADVGVAGMTVTPDREENVSFTQGYATTTQVIIVRKD